MIMGIDLIQPQLILARYKFGTRIERLKQSPVKYESQTTNHLFS